MADIKKARQLFRKAGLPFPRMPNELAARLKQQDAWLFSTRDLAVSPYNLQHYVREVDETRVEDYAVLSHSGHGVNSYALQYYLVYGPLRMFLHLGWGGVYMDPEQDKVKIAYCFSLAAKIFNTAETVEKLPIGQQLTIVGRFQRKDPPDFSLGYHRNRSGATIRKC